MIAKNKEFKIQKKRLVIHREQNTKDEQSKENKNSGIKPQRIYFRDKKLSLIENIEQLQVKSIKKITSSRSIQKINNATPLYKNNKERLQICQNKEDNKRPQPQTQKIHLIGRNTALNEIISNLLQKLKEKPLLFQPQINSYQIQKTYFVHIIQYLISILSTNDFLQCNRLFHKLHDIKTIFQSIQKYATASKNKEKNHSLSIHSNLYYEEFQHYSYQMSLEEGKKLLAKIKVLNQQAKIKQNYNRQLSDQINNKRMIISELNLKNELLQTQVRRKEKEVGKLEEMVKKFDKFAADNVQIIKQISQQFKQAQNTFHNYVNNMQSNPYLSFLDLQKNIQKEDNKTTILRECVNHLRTWIMNWNIKQQILTNLKNQFIIDNQKIYELFQQNKLNLDEPIYRHLIQIKGVYSKIEQNYKLTNLFY